MCQWLLNDCLSLATEGIEQQQQMAIIARILVLACNNPT